MRLRTFFRVRERRRERAASRSRVLVLPRLYGCPVARADKAEPPESPKAPENKACTAPECARCRREEVGCASTATGSRVIRDRGVRKQVRI
ncbi:hypothetical protein NDU88_011938 [Pleurodeles waltl]|uniref:Uncharacterized protein n=1 Tax=Pleurodeles waltl TaxID=8319 RepID=A0AAV7R1W3_PLEWA|nr:hypothetical protein NDU88_011938 [Pleurodeles waltl]